MLELVWITESHHVNISRVRESTALLLLACVCARRGGQETTATAAGCAGRGGAGRGGMASNGPQVRWRPDNTVTQLQHTQHTPSPRPGGPHPPADLVTSSTEEPSRTDARIHNIMTHWERKSWNKKRISQVWLMSHWSLRQSHASVLTWCNKLKTKTA